MAEHGTILDLFAGAGGWDEGLAQLGHHALGVEIDEIASATAEAAGHERLIADLSHLNPRRFSPTWGLIASPPCQAYSTSGKKLGHRDKQRVIACARDLSKGRDTRDDWRRRCLDPDSLLTVEPLRFALSLKPRWIAFEQVTPVAELWRVFADLLTDHGYRTEVGVLSAESYGVPQVRKRAFLIASLDGPVKFPEPTHRSFNARRHLVPEDELHLRQWVSIAEALGWGARPATLRSTHTNSGRHPGGAPRSFDRPAFTFMCGSGHWKIETEKTNRTGRPERRRPEGALTASQFRSSKHLERITVQQATIIQGFRPDYPWQGSRNDRFRQIGNSVCPPVARHVLREAMRSSVQKAGR
ncbi:MAG: DNA cytosine methyltransferase [Solirubrobacterales bacterium]|nr:DNA cytosine methyltransferase [Solirubrobacterales bacterium]